MNFNFRKIGSVLASAVMLGSTIGLAAANYPAPFVKSGAADVAVVWGSNAANTDLAAVVDITTSLQTELAKQTATGTTATSSTASGGDSYLIERASTKFHLGQGILDVVSGSITDSEMPELLKDGTFVDDDNDEFDYTQKVTLPNSTLSMFEDNDYAEVKTPTVGIRYASGSNVLNYTLDFTEEPFWADLPTTDLTFLGKTYYVLARSTNASLTLLDAAEATIINEGEEKTITVGDKTYTVKISFVGSNSTKLDVNGEITKSLNPTDTYKLKDSSYVGIKEVNYNAKDTGISSVEFSIGKGKLKLQNATDVQLNDEAISNLQTVFTSTSNTDETSGKLATITLVWNAEDDLFAAEDSSPVMPGFEALKVSYGGMSYPKTESIVVDSGSDDYLELSVDLKTSDDVTIPLLYNNGTNFTIVGQDATNKLVTSGNTTALFDGDTDEQLIVSYSDGTNAESYLVKFDNPDTLSGVNRSTVRYLKDGAWTEKQVNAVPNDVITLGSATFTVGTIDKAAKQVFLTAGTNTNFNTLYTKEGMKIFLPWINSSLITNAANVSSVTCAANLSGATNVNGQLGTQVSISNATVSVACDNLPTTYSLGLVEEDKNENKGLGKNVNITLGYNTANTEVTATAVTPSVGATSTEQGDTDKFRNFVYSALATEIIWDKSGSQDLPVTMTYHGGESYGNVFVLAPSAIVSNATSGSTGGSVKGLGSVDVKDTEISSVSTKNLIVVGGSCVNTFASQLLDGAGCGDSFTTKTGVGANQFLIQSFDRTGGKVATLVAGYNDVDTRNAAKYFTTQPVDTTAGKKYIGTSATSATLQTTATTATNTTA